MDPIPAQRVTAPRVAYARTPQPASDATAGNSILVAGLGNVISVSPEAGLASDLMDIANRFIRENSLENCAVYNRGVASEGTYINVAKYNLYIISKAADQMVADGVKGGVSLDKDSVVTALRSKVATHSIEELNYNRRIGDLGEASVLTDLSQRDLDRFTDIYIAAKEKGLDVIHVKELAVMTGIENRNIRLGVTMGVYDPETDFVGYESATESIPSRKEIGGHDEGFISTLAKGYDISTSLMKHLMNSVKAGWKDGDDLLDFLKSLAVE